jgi:hypothetical protein
VAAVPCGPSWTSPPTVPIKKIIYGSTVLLLDLCRSFSFLILYTVGRTPWTGDQPVTRPLPTHRTTQTQNKRTQTSMSQVGFEPTIPVFEGAKTVHALERAATLIGGVGRSAVFNSVLLRADIMLNKAGISEGIQIHCITET